MLLSSEAGSLFSGNLLQTPPYQEIQANSFLTSTKAGVEPAFLTGWLLTSMVKPAPQCFLFPFALKKGQYDPFYGNHY